MIVFRLLPIRKIITGHNDGSDQAASASGKAPAPKRLSYWITMTYQVRPSVGFYRQKM